MALLYIFEWRMKHFHYQAPFEFESGAVLPELTVAYNTYGQLNEEGSNVVWICHALTANSDAQQWWPGMIGEGLALDPSKYFIVCANILGSCYGTTGPLSTDPSTGKPYYKNFPQFTIRDMVNAHMLLRRHLGIETIHLLIGGSMGGYQAIEWCVMEPQRIEQLFLIGSSAKESAWGIAIHTAQRLAIEADSTWSEPCASAGQKGLKAARAIGMLTYRNFEAYSLTQEDPSLEKTDDFRASSYINYQGEKLVRRFNAFSYWYLTKAMDSHNIARGREQSTEAVLKTLKAKTLVIGITSDLLFPMEEIRHFASQIPGSRFVAIDSSYGHDGFLIEYEAISEHLRAFLKDQNPLITDIS